MVKTRHRCWVAAIAAFVPLSAPAGVIVDFAVGGNISSNAPKPITVPIDIATDGTATLNAGYVTGAGVAPVVSVSGSVSDAPASAYTMNLVLDTTAGGFRIAGGGGVGVGNNFIDAGEDLTAKLELDGAPAGSTGSALAVGFVTTGAGDGVTTFDSAVVIEGNDVVSTASTPIHSNLVLDLTGSGLGVSTGVVQGGGTQDLFKLTASPDVVRFKLASVEVDVVPEPGSLALLSLGGCMMFRRRRCSA